MKANETQIGGQHYRSEYQHWDFVHNFKLDYFEGCATKYVTRRKGNRIEDLRKARHFIVKRKEIPVLRNPCILEDNASRALVQSFCLANKLMVREQLFIMAVVSKNYDEALHHLDKLIEEEKF